MDTIAPEGRRLAVVSSSLMLGIALAWVPLVAWFWAIAVR